MDKLNQIGLGRSTTWIWERVWGAQNYMWKGRKVRCNLGCRLHILYCKWEAGGHLSKTTLAASTWASSANSWRLDQSSNSGMRSGFCQPLDWIGSVGYLRIVNVPQILLAPLFPSIQMLIDWMAIVWCSSQNWHFRNFSLYDGKSIKHENCCQIR